MPRALENDMARMMGDGKRADAKHDAKILQKKRHRRKLSAMSHRGKPQGPQAGQSSLRRRAAGFNPPPRFQPLVRLPEADGWDFPEEPRALGREIAVERPRSALSYNTSPDIGFDRSLNPYRGCEHGCIYCYARPTHAFLDLSPGLDFETRLIARPELPEKLGVELAKPGYRPAPVALGTVTDAYQPIEAKLQITRRILKVLYDFKHPVTITTRSALIERDCDLLAQMAAEGLVHVGISITTLDADLARAMEPRAPTPARRLLTLARLAQAGIPVRVMVAPLIPGLTDHELEAILAEAQKAGARAAWWSLVRLPHEVAPLFRDWLERMQPWRAKRVLNRIAVYKAGALNLAAWFARFRGTGPEAELLARRFALACRRLGLADALPDLRCDLFQNPRQAPRQEPEQLSLFAPEGGPHAAHGAGTTPQHKHAR